MSPLRFEVGGRNVLSPVLFRGTIPYCVVDLLDNACFSSPVKHNNAQ